MKTAELVGPALDWAVAKCEGLSEYETPLFLKFYKDAEGKGDAEYRYSTHWEQGGPIIEREWLDITPWPNESDEELRWQCQQHDNIDCLYFGPTPLIAAMRCYCASKLGDEVDIPEGL